EKSDDAAQCVQALGDAGVFGPEYARSYRQCLFGQYARFWKFPGIAVKQREVISALRVVGCFDPQFRLAKLESLPQQGLAFLEISRGVLEESKPVEAAALLSRIGSGVDSQPRDSNGFFQVTLAVEFLRLPVQRGPILCG